MNQKTAAKKSKKKKKTEHAFSVLNESASFTTTEEYKLLRASVAFATAPRAERCKIIGVTSAMPADGKSVTCLNLAISFALTQARVMVIDCDLRNPGLSRFLSIPASPGISNALASMCEPRDAVNEVAYGDAKFSAVAAGDIPPNPSELLGSDRMESVLEQYSESADYIFIDFPPVLMVADPLALSRQLSGYIVVVRAGRTRREDVHLVAERLNLAGANALGFVFNAADIRK